MRNPKERQFLNALGSLFTGARVDGNGKSGYINLMHIKQQHFESVRGELMKRIDKIAPLNYPFREELFDKLHSFFHRYFCESGSIYFRHLPAWHRIYERVFADGQDVTLAWKTRNLYYVKSDYLIQSMPVELPESGTPKRFYFDASAMQGRQNNEPREFVFSFSDKQDQQDVTCLNVSFSKNGQKTKIDEILKLAREHQMWLIDEDDIKNAIRIFRRQTEVDFFINKDAGGFLHEQFNLWLYQYMFSEESIFEQQRIEQLSELRRIARYIIDFIAQFEDELARVWNKPKFARHVNYVMTADKLSPAIMEKMGKHQGVKAQVQEWQDLGMVDGEFNFAHLGSVLTPPASKRKNGGNGKNGGGNLRFLPFDTKHFKDLEEDMLACLGDLDTALDGELIKSENYQALLTIARKYRGRVKCIYIDPPFNLDSSDQFSYRTNYKDSCWATLLENRLSLARDFLTDDGGIFVKTDSHCNWIARKLLDDTGLIKINEIIVSRGRETVGSPNKLEETKETIFLYGNQNFNIVKIKAARPVSNIQWTGFTMGGERNPPDRLFFGKKLYPPQGQHFSLKQEKVNLLLEDKFLRLKCRKCKSLYYHSKSDDALSRYMKKQENRFKFYDIHTEIIFYGVDKLTTCLKCGSDDFHVEYLGASEMSINDVWLDIETYDKQSEFKTQNSEELLLRCNRLLGDKGITFDFFSGSGTSPAVAQKLGRKWLGVEMGEHFDTVVLPRLKKVLFGYQTGVSKDLDYKGGGAFKYYELEQYEDTLKKMRYHENDLPIYDEGKSLLEQYVFLGDDKLSQAVTSDKKLSLDLDKLYSGISLSETLANALGSPLRRCQNGTAEFANGEKLKINFAEMTEEEKIDLITRIRPYLWWGE